MYTYDTVREKLRQIIDAARLDNAVLSSPAKKGEGTVFKIRVKGALKDGELYFQLSKYVDTKVLHENCTPNELIDKLIDAMREYTLKQCVITANNNAVVLMNKKGDFSITGVKPNPNAEVCRGSHNRDKNYILSDGSFVPWLYKLGVTDKNGIVLNHKQKKFRQINRFLEMLRDVEDYIPENSLIVDMGCGKSYLTFAMYWYFNEIKHKSVQIKGFDLKKDVVDYCNSLTEQFAFKNLHFFAGDIADIDNIDGKISMIVTLHACDTATDIALYHGIRWGCKVIMSVPCCQHEINSQIGNRDMDIILKHGILKERFSAIMTDAVRAQILEIKGYKTAVMEFIDMEHTPKNIMIRAVKGKNSEDNTQKLSELEKMLNDFNVEQTLFKLCFEKNDKKS